MFANVTIFSLAVLFIILVHIWHDKESTKKSKWFSTVVLYIWFFLVLMSASSYNYKIVVIDNRSNNIENIDTSVRIDV